MIQLSDKPVVVYEDKVLDAREARQKGIDPDSARGNTLAAGILKAHNSAPDGGRLRIRFDALASHDITYVGIIQSARASGLKEFPVPYVLTNCHNSLCAVGGTINEDDHAYGLAAARKYGGIYVPAHMAVIHQYMREMMAKPGSMILGSDSHTRYGALGCMGVGEGGPELVKQLLGQTWDIPDPEVVLVWLEGSPRPGVGPQDVALAIIGAVFDSGFVKNRILEFMGPGIANLSMDYRNGIEVMTTETACLSSIWPVDAVVEKWLELHGRKDDFRPLRLSAPASYSRMVRVDLDRIEPMVALPFHPGNVHTLKELIDHPDELLGEVDSEAEKLFGDTGRKLNLRKKIKNGAIVADQGVIAGCAGGTFENISYASAILSEFSASDPSFTFSLYPSSVPVAASLINNGATPRLMSLGAVVRTSFCGPCFGAGDTPAHGALSLRHTTRNFQNREGSKPGEGQLCAVALMDARSIAATAANGGILRPATEMDWNSPSLANINLGYHFAPEVYKKRVYNGYGKPRPDAELILGPNIADWPDMEPLPEHLILQVAAVLKDPVTTTDELIPSGETSSLRSNPQKLAEFTLSRKDPAYVGRARAMLAVEKAWLGGSSDGKSGEILRSLLPACKDQAEARAVLEDADKLRNVGFGSLVFALRPGDGSAREQAASCQKILGGWANLAVEYATKRYRSNLINWGILPLLAGRDLSSDLQPGDYVILPHVRAIVANNENNVLAALVHCGNDGKTWAEQIGLRLPELSDEERQILLAGCLINYYAGKNK